MTQRKPLPEIARCVCGKTPEMFRAKSLMDAARKFIRVQCANCWCGPYRKSERAAILAWNRVMNKGSLVW